MNIRNVMARKTFERGYQSRYRSRVGKMCFFVATVSRIAHTTEHMALANVVQLTAKGRAFDQFAQFDHTWVDKHPILDAIPDIAEGDTFFFFATLRLYTTTYHGRHETFLEEKIGLHQLCFVQREKPSNAFIKKVLYEGKDNADS